MPKVLRRVDAFGALLMSAFNGRIRGGNQDRGVAVTGRCRTGEDYFFPLRTRSGAVAAGARRRGRTAAAPSDARGRSRNGSTVQTRHHRNWQDARSAAPTRRFRLQRHRPGRTEVCRRPLPAAWYSLHRFCTCRRSDGFGRFHERKTEYAAVLTSGCGGRSSANLLIFKRPVSIAVARRTRHNTLAKRKTSSRSTAVWASNSAVIEISNAL
jgi:hypothetical protein